jgi:ubiquinone/menaquinone biosynthesis C-methylase UbiE
LTGVGCDDCCCRLSHWLGEKGPEKTVTRGEAGAITQNAVTKIRLNPFDVEADRYDLWFGSCEGKAIFEIENNCLRTLIQTATGLWLEVGVGSGRFATSLGISEGVDPSMEMLTIAARRGVHVLRGIGEDLPYQDATFEGVLLVTTLCFLMDPKRALSECRRVLRASGTLALAIIPTESPWG